MSKDDFYLSLQGPVQQWQCVLSEVISKFLDVTDNQSKPRSHIFFKIEEFCYIAIELNHPVQQGFQKHVVRPFFTTFRFTIICLQKRKILTTPYARVSCVSQVYSESPNPLWWTILLLMPGILKAKGCAEKFSTVQG